MIDQRVKSHEPIYDRLLVYVNGGLDVECTNFDVEYTIAESKPQTKITIERFVLSNDETFDLVYSAWIEQKKIRVGTQFGASGKIFKTEGSVSSLKLVSNTGSTKMIFSLTFPTIPFK